MINAVIDLSHHQNHVDFNKVKAAGIIGVIHKATQGLSMTDPRYESRRELALAAGLKWGAYHFGVGADGSDQADRFVDLAQPDSETLIVLDYEPNPQGSTMTRTQALEFIQHVEAVTGRAPGLYTGAAMATAFSPDMSKCWLWWAQYNISPSRVPKQIWPNWTLWQYTDGAVGPQPRAVDGVGFCDRNKFNGQVDGLLRLWGVPDDQISSAR